MSSEKVTGKCKWFSEKKGFGFIIPDNGDEEIFVHQTDIHAQDFRSLQEGEVVEYVVITEEDGRKKATQVTGPDGAHVKGR